MAANYSERVYKISVDGAQAIKQLEKISGSASSIDQRMAKVGSTLRTVFAVGAVAAGARALSNEIMSISQSFDDMGKAAQKVGVAAEALSGLKFAAGQSGVEFDTLQGGLRKLSVALNDINDASSETSQLLKQMGVTASDTADTAFRKIADRISEMPDGIQKTAAAMKLFGKAGAEMVPLLNEGADGLDKFQKRAEELGLILKDQTIAQLTIFNDSLDELGKAAEGVKNKIIQGLAPALAAIAKSAADSTTVSDAWVWFGKKVGEAFIYVAREANLMLTDLQLIYEFGKAVKNLDLDTFYNVTKPALWAANDAFNARLDENLRAMEELTGSAGKAGDAIGTLGGKMEQGPLEKWAEGLKNSAQDLDLIVEKMRILDTAIANMAASGKSDPNLLKVMNEELDKLRAKMNEGNLVYKLEQDIAKARKEIDDTAASLEILADRLATALAVGDMEGFEIILKMMDKLRGKTDEVSKDFNKLGESITDAIYSNANSAVNNFIDNIGKAQTSFTDFATSMVKDLAKVIVQLLIMKPLVESIKGLFGFSVTPNAQGNAFAGGTGLAQGIYSQPTFFKFAKGGTFGNTGVLGEAGPEAIIPLRRTASGDLGVQGSPVNVNVYNNAGVDIQTQTSTSADGTKQIDVYIEKKVRDGISSGAFDRVFRGAYGLSRVGA